MGYPVTQSYPINAAGEIILEVGTSDTTPVGYLSENFVPISPFGGVPVAGISGSTVSITASRSLTATDNGKILVSAAGAPINLTLTNNLPAGFGCAVVQGNANAVTIIAGSGTTLSSVASHTKTSGANSMIAIVQPSANNYILVGQGA